MGLVVPLTGMGFGLSALSGLLIPNFITSVIYANPLYLSGYTALIILLAVVGVLSIFVFHVVLLRGTTVWGGFRFSWRLVRQQARLFFLGLLPRLVVLFLDYDLIRYIEDKHPEIEIGYLFYFSVGEDEMLVGDYLILEEDAATPERIARIHAGGKKAVVWTVNTRESMEKFLGSEADGLITDHVTQVKDTEEEMAHRTDLQRVVDTLFVG